MYLLDSPRRVTKNLLCRYLVTCICWCILMQLQALCYIKKITKVILCYMYIDISVEVIFEDQIGSGVMSEFN